MLRYRNGRNKLYLNLIIMWGSDAKRRVCHNECHLVHQTQVAAVPDSAYIQSIERL